MKKKNSIIEKVSEILREFYPKVIFEINMENEIEIPKITENGFDILIRQDKKEYTLYFSGWHLHFNNNEDGKNELVNYLLFGLSKLSRLKTIIINGNEYKWTLEIKDENEIWTSNGTTALINLKFWQKKEVKYLQNDIITPEN